MLGRVDQGFVDICAMALNAAISGSIIADPDARGWQFGLPGRQSTSDSNFDSGDGSTGCSLPRHRIETNGNAAIGQAGRSICHRR